MHRSRPINNIIINLECLIKRGKIVPRDIVIGNGQIIIAFDDKLALRDFFYPQVGLENHLNGHKIKTGLWIDGEFKWIDQNWEVIIEYLPETLVTKCKAKNNELGIELEINDAVHNSFNVYLRKLKIKNLTNNSRNLRLFFAQDFHLYGENSGDTARYEPENESIVHYKRKRYFMINGKTDDQKPINQFAIGYKESLNREGTWKDAEDGILEGNPIAQGVVDSVISFNIRIKPNTSRTSYYWIACGKSLPEVKQLDKKVNENGIEQLLLETENYGSALVNRPEINLQILPTNMIRLFKSSLLIMRAHVGIEGSIIASCDSDVLQFNRDTYSYVWPRDGAITASAFDLAGFGEISKLFFEFCNKTITDQGYFNHKYWSDGSVGSSWHSLIDLNGNIQLPIQEDETAHVLCALWKHFQKYRDLEFISKVYQNLVVKPTKFLIKYIDEETGLPKPSFDMWEEKRGIFTSTTAVVYSALVAAAKFAQVFFNRKRQRTLEETSNNLKKNMIEHLYDKKLGRFVKAIYPDGSKDTTIDSNLCLLFTSKAFEASNNSVKNTIKAIEERLWVKTHIGGVARYENDDYRRISNSVPGNPWIISTLWLARWYISKAASENDLKRALELLNWVVERSSTSGMLPEQIDPFSGEPVSVSPLVWSHAEYVIAICEYLEKQKIISLANTDSN